MRKNWKKIGNCWRDSRESLRAVVIARVSWPPADHVPTFVPPSGGERKKERFLSSKYPGLLCLALTSAQLAKRLLLPPRFFGVVMHYVITVIYRQ